MHYQALIDIGEFKKGNVIPEEKALLWNKMYARPVAELVDVSSAPATNIPDEESPAMSAPIKSARKRKA